MNTIPGAWPTSPRLPVSTLSPLPGEEPSGTGPQTEPVPMSMDNGRSQSRSHPFPSHLRSVTPQRPRCREYDVLGSSAKRRLSYAQTMSQAIRANQSRPRKPPVNLHESKHPDEESRPRKHPVTPHKSQQPDEEAKKVQATIKRSNSQDPTITNLENERNWLKELARSSNAQMDLYKRELQKTLGMVQDKDSIIARIEEDKLALERSVEEHAESEAKMTAKLQKAKFKAALYKALDKTGNDKMISEYREASKAQWLRANDAEQHVRRLEHDLAHANAELQDARNSSHEILMLQQRLDTSVENSHKADHKIQRLQEALAMSNDNAAGTYQQYLAHVQSLNEGANQEAQRLNELRTQEKARADQAEHAYRGLQQTNAEQAAVIEALQQEAKKWKDVAEDRAERATVATREVEDKTQQLVELRDRANDAEAKVGRLEQEISNMETAVPREREAAREPSPDFEAACVITEQNDRLERELEEATELLEELVSSGMDTACRDVLENLVYTNQSFKSLEAEFEDHYNPSVNAVNSILEDATANLDDLLLIENADRPVLVRQLKEAHGVRMRIDEIILDAQMLGQRYLDDKDTVGIKQILKSPRTLSGLEATASSSSSSSPSPFHPNTSTTAPLYSPPRPQQVPSTIPYQLPGLQLPGLQLPGLQLPGLQLPNPTASPSSGGPPPFNPLFDSPQPANPSTPAPSSIPYRQSASASAGSSIIPLLGPPRDSSDSSSDSSSEDEQLPEAFAGQYDQESDSDDAMVPPVGEREIRQPVSRRRRYPRAADFF